MSRLTAYAQINLYVRVEGGMLSEPLKSDLKEVTDMEASRIIRKKILRYAHFAIFLKML